MKYIVKYGIDTLQNKLTQKQAIKHGNKIMPRDLKLAGFVTSLFICDSHVRINFSKA
jgi:hypothetical protein